MKIKLSTIILAVGLITSFFMFSACSQTQNPDKASSGMNGSASSESIVSSSALGSSGFESGSANSSSMEPAVVRKTIGTKGKGSTVKKVTLLNLTGQNITGFTIKHSLEPQFGANMLETGDTFLMDESRDVYYDIQKALDAQAALTAEEKANQLYLTYNVQIVLADGSVFTIHEFPFNNLENGRIVVQNWTCFLEYIDQFSGEEVVTRQKEIDANAADQAAAYAAQQEQWVQQQQWAQQQQYVAPVQNNDAGCVGDPSLVW